MANQVEIELKFKLDQPMKDFLAKIGVKTERVYQKTVMFDNEQGLMQITNGRIRLRQHGNEVSLSYKLPIESKIVKKEIEYETAIDTWEIGEKLLLAMGFHPTTSYEKYRTTFKHSEVKVEIDEYPFATFVEIEGEENRIKDVAIELGFNLKDALTEACDGLFLRWRKERNLPPKPHMLFEDYNK
ncbi:MAG: class IV adenylate cyclase [Patescibacteria group bacterium]